MRGSSKLWLGGAALAACTRTEPIAMPPEAPPAACASEGRDACAAACDTGDGVACLAASVAYGSGSDPNKEMMRALERRACDLGVGLGCYWYANNFTPGTQADRVIGAEYDGKACDAGYVAGCMRRAFRALEPETEGILDPEAAIGALEKACDLENPSACAMAADLRHFGIGAPRDAAAAKAGYSRACTLGRSRDDEQLAACHNAEGSHADHWVTLWYPVLVEPLFDPIPELDPRGGGGPGFRARTRVRFCVDKGSSGVTDAAVAVASSEPEVDAVLVDAVRTWRLRVRPFVDVSGPLCHILSVEYLNPGKPGSGG